MDLDKQLTLAKKLRERKIARLTAISNACCCVWPLVTYRNQHGHSGDCPAIAVWQRFRDEDDERRAEIDP